MNTETPLNELTDQLSNWGLHYLAGAVTESIRSKGTFTEADLRMVVDTARATPLLMKVGA